MDKFYKINVKDQKPEVSGWYDTDKGRVFFFHNEGEFSCRQDYISKEYPTWWLKKDSNQEMQEFVIWLYLNDWKLWDHASKPPLLYKKGSSIESHMIMKTIPDLFEIFIKETSNK